MWADHMIQAVAESLKLKIHIVNSREQFSEVTLVQAVHTLEQNLTSIYLGHLDKIHYVSTIQALCQRNTDYRNDILESRSTCVEMFLKEKVTVIGQMIIIRQNCQSVVNI